MNTAENAELELARLEAQLLAVDPAILFVSPRILRRVIWQQHEEDVNSFQVLRCHFYVVDRTVLLHSVNPAEIAPRDPLTLPDVVVLVARPTEAELVKSSYSTMLRRYQRLLLQGLVQSEVADRFANEMGDEDLHARINAIGREEWDEIEHVLKQEDTLFSADFPALNYAQFVSYYVDLTRFEPEAFAIHFPALRFRTDIDAIVTRDVPVDEIVKKVFQHVDVATESQPLPVSERFAMDDTISTTSDVDQSIEEAKKSARSGNNVRSLIIHVRLWHRHGASDTNDKAWLDAREQLRELTQRLGNALGLTSEETSQWQETLMPLVPIAGFGFWSGAARLLYDLQKTCLVAERGSHVIDLVSWIRTWGKVPLRRPLPAHSQVQKLRHLRAASRRLLSLPLSENEKDRLESLLERVIHREEEAVRQAFRPVLQNALEEVELSPRNLPEKVAQAKLREELLDRILQSGLLILSDLRDAISRNQIKLEDLGQADTQKSANQNRNNQRFFAGFREFLGDDKLLRLNAVLKRDLPGVYRAGEIYLRWLQSFTSVMFGTVFGRFFTRYLAVPFGGAFVALKGIFFMTKETLELGFGIDTHGWKDPITSLWSVGLLGAVVLGLMEWRSFRNAILQIFHGIGRGLHFAFVRVPNIIRRLAFIQFLLNIPVIRFFQQHLFKPLMLSALLAWIFYLAEFPNSVNFFYCCMAFLGFFAFFSSRFGKVCDEVVSDWVVSTWHQFSIYFVPAVFNYVMDGFKWLLNEIERYLYSFDEWLRFRSASESRLTQITVGVFGLIWSSIFYFVRVLLVLCIEPTVNPIKHFPVVTVAGKFMVPVVGFLAPILMESVGPWWTGLISTLLIGLVPGVAGFLVWELKENWRLYESNRPKTLGPIRIGDHGETFLQFLRPGFHSGTIPKQYAKYRKAQRQHNHTALHRCQHELEHVRHSLKTFFEREFIQLVDGTDTGKGLALQIGQINLANNQIAVYMASRKYSQEPIGIQFSLKDRNYLLVSFRQHGWFSSANEAERAIILYAFLGIYKLCRVDFVDQQIRTQAKCIDGTYDIDKGRLWVWPQKTIRPCIVYNLQGDKEKLVPSILDDEKSVDWPTLSKSDLFFGKSDLQWSTWVKIWQEGPEKQNELPPIDDIDEHTVVEGMGEIDVSGNAGSRIRGTGQSSHSSHS